MKKRLKHPILSLILTSTLFQLPIFYIILKKDELEKYYTICFLLAITSLVSMTRWTFSNNRTIWKLDNFFAKFSFYFFTNKYIKQSFKHRKIWINYIFICFFYIIAQVSYDYKFKYWWALHGMFHISSVYCICTVLKLLD